MLSNVLWISLSSVSSICLFFIKFMVAEKFMHFCYESNKRWTFLFNYLILLNFYKKIYTKNSKQKLPSAWKAFCKILFNLINVLTLAIPFSWKITSPYLPFYSLFLSFIIFFQAISRIYFWHLKVEILIFLPCRCSINEWNIDCLFSFTKAHYP